MKKAVLILTVLLCGITIIFIAHRFKPQLQQQLNQLLPPVTPPAPPKKIVWMNIFIHGSFGSLLGLISLPNVLKDQVHGTTYRGLNKNMRDDIFFFQSQPILERGIQAITPTFHLPEQPTNRYAAYPITKAFDELIRISLHGDFEQLYYTFGWSGLISQHRRRFEAIRFYNALQEEIAALRAKNIEPRIRLLAHSHGGNICLNLGAIVPIMHTKTFNDFHKYSLDPAADEAIRKMLTIIKSLPTQELASSNEGQKKYDYVPTAKDLEVEELIMLGTPIQAETEHFLNSPVFKRVYNIYSEADVIQQMDWVSTKNQKSKQRADIQPLQKTSLPRLIQVKVMYERKVEKKPDKEIWQVVKNDPTHETSLVDSLLGTRMPSKDPDHRKLWFLGSDKETPDGTESFLYPLPTVIFLPPILALLEKNPAQADVDVNIALEEKEVIFYLTKHDDNVVLATSKLPRSLLNEIQEHVAPWVPKNTTARKEFDVIYRHLTKSNQPHDKPLQQQP